MSSKRNTWTEQEDKYLKDNFQKLTKAQIGEDLGKTKGAVEYRASQLGLIKQPHKPWTEEEDNFLRENYLTMTSKEIAKKLGRTAPSIDSREGVLGLQRLSYWTQEEIDFLKENYMNYTHAELGKLMNRPEQGVRIKAQDLGLFKKEPDWTEEDVQYLKENYMNLQTREIAEKLGRTMTAINIKAKKLGLKKYPYTCDYHFFDEIDTEEKAYWFGFMFADGWTNKNEKNNAGAVGMELQYGDIGHLKKFNKSISGNYRITDRWRPCTLSNSEELHHYCCIRVFSIVMYNSLFKYGFTGDKTYTCKFPKIPAEGMRHFLRGYFDGDGRFCFTDKSFGVSFITASEQWSNDLIEYLNKLGFHTGLSTTVNEYGTTIYMPQLTRKADMIGFLDYLYEDANIYLDRKYKKYLKVKEYFRTHEAAPSRNGCKNKTNAEENGNAGMPTRMEGCA